jgi:hypothetical protein
MIIILLLLLHFVIDIMEDIMVLLHHHHQLRLNLLLKDTQFGMVRILTSFFSWLYTLFFPFFMSDVCKEPSLNLMMDANYSFLVSTSSLLFIVLHSIVSKKRGKEGEGKRFRLWFHTKRGNFLFFIISLLLLCMSGGVKVVEKEERDKSSFSFSCSWWERKSPVRGRRKKKNLTVYTLTVSLSVRFSVVWIYWPSNAIISIPSLSLLCVSQKGHKKHNNQRRRTFHSCILSLFSPFL